MLMICCVRVIVSSCVGGGVRGGGCSCPGSSRSCRGGGRCEYGSVSDICGSRSASASNRLFVGVIRICCVGRDCDCSGDVGVGDGGRVGGGVRGDWIGLPCSSRLLAIVDEDRVRGDAGVQVGARCRFFALRENGCRKVKYDCGCGGD